MIIGSDKYTNKDVDRVRRLYTMGYSTPQIADMCGVPVGSLRGGDSVLLNGLPLRSVAAGKRSAHLMKPARVNQDREFIRLVNGYGVPICKAGAMVGLNAPNCYDRYRRSLYCRALRQYVYGEKCGLPLRGGAGTALARRYLTEHGIPLHLVDALLPTGGDDDDN